MINAQFEKIQSALQLAKERLSTSTNDDLDSPIAYNEIIDAQNLLIKALSHATNVDPMYLEYSVTHKEETGS
jgi:hypothetical protein